MQKVMIAAVAKTHGLHLAMNAMLSPRAGKKLPRLPLQRFGSDPRSNRVAVAPVSALQSSSGAAPDHSEPITQYQQKYAEHRRWFEKMSLNPPAASSSAKRNQITDETIALHSLDVEQKQTLQQHENELYSKGKEVFESAYLKGEKFDAKVHCITPPESMTMMWYHLLCDRHIRPFKPIENESPKSHHLHPMPFHKFLNDTEVLELRNMSRQDKDKCKFYTRALLIGGHGIMQVQKRCHVGSEIFTIGFRPTGHKLENTNQEAIVGCSQKADTFGTVTKPRAVFHDADNSANRLVKSATQAVQISHETLVKLIDQTSRLAYLTQLDEQPITYSGTGLGPSPSDYKFNPEEFNSREEKPFRCDTFIQHVNALIGIPLKFELDHNSKLQGVKFLTDEEIKADLEDNEIDVPIMKRYDAIPE